MKTDITFGDLVAVDGYPDRIFFVDSRRDVKETDDAGVSTYVEFDLTDAIHGEWILADANDIRLVCRSQYVDEYLDGVEYKGTSFVGKQIGSSSYAGLEHWKGRIEVIGDVYRNPELLEAAE